MANNLEELVADLDVRIAKHESRGALDAFWHNFLIIFALAAGVASLVAGLLWQSGPAAAVIGVIPSACALLLSNLDCVRAKNWHAKMIAGLNGLRRSLKFETKDASFEDVAKCSKALTELETSMANEWAEGEKDKKLNFTVMKRDDAVGKN
ncbi:hypothetical protein [Bradyrhizobium guangdongense]